MQTKDKLLDAASARFYERGIAATGVDDVVHAAGVSEPTLHGASAEAVADATAAARALVAAA